MVRNCKNRTINELLKPCLDYNWKTFYFDAPIQIAQLAH
jgi:hypothetical protein